MRYFVLEIPGQQYRMIFRVREVRALRTLPESSRCYQVWTYRNDIVDTIDYRIEGGRVLLPPRSTHGHTAQWAAPRDRRR